MKILYLFIQKAYAFKIMMPLEEAQKYTTTADCKSHIKDLGGGFVDVPSECLEIAHVQGLALQFIQIFFTTLIPVSGIVLIWGAYQYLTAYGNEEKAQRGKNIILWAIVGLVIAFLAQVIIAELWGLIYCTPGVPCKLHSLIPNFLDFFNK